MTSKGSITRHFTGSSRQTKKAARVLAKVLDYAEYRNFIPVIDKAKIACSNSGQEVPGHFVDFHEMVRIGSGAERPLKNVKLSRYACYLIVQNADPTKPIVANGQTYFAVQTRRQELAAEGAQQATGAPTAESPLCGRRQSTPALAGGIYSTHAHDR